MNADDLAPRDPALEHVLDAFGRSLLDGVEVAMLGRIVEYDAAKQMASVQLLVRKARVDASGDRVVQSVPPLHGVPVKFNGGGGARLTFPVAVGDTCLVWFCSRSIARQLLVGGEVDPGDDRRHDLSDAVCEVGVHDFAHVPTAAPTDATVLHAGSHKLKLGGPTGTQPTLMADSFMSALDAFITSLAAAISPITGGGAAAAIAIGTAKTALDTAAAGFKTSTTEVK